MTKIREKTVPCSSPVASIQLELHVPVQYLTSPPDRWCRIDASIEATNRVIQEVIWRHPTVTSADGSSIDLGCRISHDGEQYYSFWAARAKTQFDDQGDCFVVEGRKFWESSGEEYGAHLGAFDTKVSNNSLFERLDAGQELAETFWLMESLLPSPFPTLDAYMYKHEQQDGGPPGDPDGKAFNRYLADCIDMVEQPGYATTSKTTFYRFLLAWNSARRTLGLHIRVVPSLHHAHDGSRLIEFSTHVSVGP